MDDGNWQRYSKANCVSSKAIEHAYKANPNVNVEFNIGDTSYRINFTTMTQKNNRTRKCRRLKRVSSGLSTTGAAVANSVQSSGQKYTWFWLTDRRDWRPYNANSSNEIEQVFATDPLSIFRCWLGAKQYEINLQTRLQTSIEKHKRRPIKRASAMALQSPHVWQWEGRRGSWTEFDAANGALSSEEIEDRYTLNQRDLVYFKKGRTLYEINLGRMQQTNKDTGAVRRVHRVLRQQQVSVV